MELLFVLISGVAIGWILEFFYKLYDRKKIVYPKLVSVQMYMWTSLFSYILYIYHPSVIFVTVFLLVFTTGVELITGYFFFMLRGYIPWDYSKYKINYKKIICLRFSLYWFIIALVYYYFVLPIIISLLF